METVVYGRLTIDVPWLLFRFAEACNTQACPVRLKRCPGSYRQYNATSQVDVLVECGGHGVCYRATPTCIESDPTCTAVCTCDAGYATSDCSLTSAQFAASQQIRSACFNALVCLGGEIALVPVSTSVVGCWMALCRVSVFLSWVIVWVRETRGRIGCCVVWCRVPLLLSWVVW